MPATAHRSDPPAAAHASRTLYWVNAADWAACPEQAKSRLLKALEIQGMELALNPANDQATWQARIEVVR